MRATLPPAGSQTARRYRRGMELADGWRGAVADEALRRVYPDPGFDDGDWTAIAVPGHWRSAPDFADTDGPVLMRTAFEAPAPPEGRRAWLTFDGIFYQSDVWLDGAYVGDTEGYFFPHTFEVTEPLRARAEHLLAVEVTCAPQRNRRAKRNLTGVFQHWDCLDPDWNPGGIWRPVRLEETGPVRISRLRVLCGEATPQRAVLTMRAMLDATERCTVNIRTILGDGNDHVEEQTLAAGENRVEWRVGINEPRLWWPHALGAPELTDVTVDVVLEGDSEPSDSHTVRTGIRQVRMRDWIFNINGERMFLKGSNQGPTRMALGEATAEDLERDVVLARGAGLDLLRIHGHVARPELYDAADRHGLLLWQDLPLQWGYARGVRRQAMRQARRAVDLLGHHPSVAIWCGHNDPMSLDVEPGQRLRPRLAGQAILQQQLPTWNKTILDRSVRRALERSDRSRPVIAHSGVIPHIGSGGTDTHQYFGWYWGEATDLPDLAAAWPRLMRFVSEFGAQAVPAADEFLEPERWPDLDWARLSRTHGLQKAVFEANGLAPEAFESFDAWRLATQLHQAEVVRFHIEHLRRLKYHPTGGFAQFSFADGHPAVSWSVLDHERRTKLAHDALVAACAPVIVVADPLGPAYSPGDALAVDVHVVSDRRDAIDGARVAAELSWPGGGHTWHFEGDIAADACVRVGMVRAVVADTEGPLLLELRLEGPGLRTTNRYASVVVR